MRLFITSLLFILTSCGAMSSVEAQTNINAPFVGTWEWENGNQTFRVELYLNEDNRIRGHYTMVETNSQGLEIIVYKSNKDIGFGHTYGPVIYGGSNGTTLGAGIVDVVTPNPDKHPALEGTLTMKIITTGNCIGCTTTATWKVKQDDDLRFENDTRTLSIPTDITLTKVQ